MKLQWMLVAVALSVCSLAANARIEDQLDADARRPHDVQVLIEPQAAFVAASEDVRVILTFANVGRKTVTLTRWFVPSDEFDEPLFSVTRDGVPVAYLGPIVKRAAPTGDDLMVLEPGAQVSMSVDLSGSYDFSADGEYVINYGTRSAHLFGPGQGDVSTLVSPAVAVAVEGRPFRNPDLLIGDGLKGKKPPGGGTGGGNGLTFTGGCSVARQATLVDALTVATNYASAASSYLNGTPSATQRYTTWFGTYSSAGWNEIKENFAAIHGAFATKPLTLDCSCKKNYYAYVYPTQPYKIYVCNAFWAAPLSGTDSKGGTLIHEMSHFDVVAGTDDWAYGQSAAKSLAISNPTRARNNADSHEYFAENTPALP